MLFFQSHVYFVRLKYLDEPFFQTYEAKKSGDSTEISWSNTNNQGGWFNVAAGLQYGHGTGTGGWVEGVDYINPAMKPLFDKIENGVWNEIQSS